MSASNSESGCFTIGDIFCDNTDSDPDYEPDPGLGASSKHPNLEVNLENSLLSNEGCKNCLLYTSRCV